MNCPHCNFRFRAFALNADAVPEIAPLICESCAEIAVLEDHGRSIRKPTNLELIEIKRSPAWTEVLVHVQRMIRESKAPSADRTQTTLTDGSPVTPDHRELRPDGQQKAYVVLSAEERAKGFVRPLRFDYTHLVCGSDTTMGYSLSATYARDPGFYGATFCCHCRAHFPLAEFVWKGTDEKVGS